MAANVSKWLRSVTIRSGLLLSYGVALLMLVIMALGIAALTMELLALGDLRTGTGTLMEFIDRALLVLIAMELFRTVMAYVTSENEVLAVLEASLVAVAREVILVGKEAHDPWPIAAMALLLVAVFVTYIAAYRWLWGEEVQVVFP